MKLRWNNAVIMAAVLVPVIASAGVAVYMLAQAERHAALGTLHQSAVATVIAIDRELAEADAAMRTLVSQRALFEGPDYRALYAAAQAANGKDSTAWIVVADEQGRQIVNTNAAYGVPLPVFPQRPDASQAEAPAVSNVIAQLPTGRNATLVSQTVVLPNGRSYLAAKVFPAAYFDRTFQREGQGSDWVTAIFDRNYRTIARTHKPEQFVGTLTLPDTAAALANPTTRILRHTIRGNIEVYDVFARSARSGWSVALGAPVDIVEAEVRRAVTVAIVGLAVATLLGLLLATLYGGRVVRAMVQLGVAARLLGRGHRPGPIRHTGIEEVDGVSAALTEAGELLAQEREQKARAETQREHLMQAAEEARAYAERQNKSKDEFIALLGHELRNPLSAINSAVALMELAPGDGERTQRAQAIIKRQSDHLARMVNDLLDLSRVLAGKVYLEKRTVDLRDAVLQCIESLTMNRTGLPAFRADCQPGITVHADATRLDQMLTNLLGNAAKFTPQSGHVDVRVYAQDGVAVLEVADTGIGIAPEVLPHVFEPFVQGQQALDRSRGGLGIGLSLVRRLAELHGGTVTAQSGGPGQGTTMTVRLPLADAVADSEPLDRAAGTANGLRVLLVDDHEDGRTMNAEVIRAAGHAVDECATAVETFQRVQEKDFDAIVIDIGLPGMDGYQIAQHLLAQFGERRVRLIALTGYGSAADRSQALAAGFDLHLVKPVTQAILLDALTGPLARAA
ncbi:hybrid sensor histidine kinase/response regulator [Oxalobacteraceae bacterium OM1]|nr:hybrid sensor histidine kinase/response regulator [Oxalobacteraceae bacterium OM1]